MNTKIHASRKSFYATFFNRHWPVKMTSVIRGLIRERLSTIYHQLRCRYQYIAELKLRRFLSRAYFLPTRHSTHRESRLRSIFFRF